MAKRQTGELVNRQTGRKEAPMSKSRSGLLWFGSRLVLAAFLVALFWYLLPSLRAGQVSSGIAHVPSRAGQVSSNTEEVWEKKYQQAHQARSTDEDLAIRMFRDVADHAGPDLASRALLQISIIYRQSLMEPRKALETLEEFNRLSGVSQHRSYAESVRVRTHLKSALGVIDALEKALPPPPDAPGTTATLMAIGDAYRQKLETPNYAFRFYDRAYTASSKTLDVACYLRGHCKMDLAEYTEAVPIFEDFIRRFPKSYLHPSAIDLLYRCKYLHVFHVEIASQRNREAAKLIREIDEALAAYPKLDPVVRQYLRNYQRLTKNLLPVSPPVRQSTGP
jgi:tetratricopeptide (TPR) repeat protein